MESLEKGVGFGLFFNTKTHFFRLFFVVTRGKKKLTRFVHVAKITNFRARSITEQKKLNGIRIWNLDFETLEFET
jgi:hypothetical protein